MNDYLFLCLNRPRSKQKALTFWNLLLIEETHDEVKPYAKHAFAKYEEAIAKARELQYTHVFYKRYEIKDEK